MIQFYFLSILLNALSGLVLIRDEPGIPGSSHELLGIPFKDDTFRLVLGALTALMGLLKLLSSYSGDLPVIGDLVPALTGLVTGFIGIFDFYRGHGTLNTESSKRMDQLLTGKRKGIGFAAIASAILHFLFPSALFL